MMHTITVRDTRNILLKSVKNVTCFSYRAIPGKTMMITVAEAGEFLAEYTAWLWGSGATCIRIEKNVDRISRAFGLETVVTVMPRHVQLAVKVSGGNDTSVFVRRPPRCGIDFTINTGLSRLSWAIADGRIGFEGARRCLARIVSEPGGNQWHVLLLTSLANASFCRLFCGDAVAMAVVFVATLAGFRLKQIMLAHRSDLRLTFVVCAFFSAAISAGAHLFGWGETPGTAMATSVLYLIPGVPYINSASDLIDGHYLCAFSRFTDACVLTACLSAGLCGGIILFGLTWI